MTTGSQSERLGVWAKNLDPPAEAAGHFWAIFCILIVSESARDWFPRIARRRPAFGDRIYLYLTCTLPVSDFFLFFFRSNVIGSQLWRSVPDFGNPISLFPDAYGVIRYWFAVMAKYTRFWKSDFPVSRRLWGDPLLVRSYGEVYQILKYEHCFRTRAGRSVDDLLWWQDMPDFGTKKNSLFPDACGAICGWFTIMARYTKF